MLTLFYPWVEKAAKWQEMRYSLRSAEANLKTDFEVVIASPEPATFLDPTKYRHIRMDRVKPIGDCSPAMFDVGRKLLRAATDPSISDPFLMVHDDFFFLRKTKVRDLEAYLNMVMDNVVAKAERNMENPFIDSLWRAAVELKKLGLTTWNPCLHLPRLMYKKQAEAAAKLCLTTGANWEMLYFNMVLKRGVRVTFYAKGSKLKAGFYGKDNIVADYVPEGASLADVAKIIDPCAHLSFNDTGFHPLIGEYLERKFQNKSKWEV